MQVAELQQQQPPQSQGCTLFDGADSCAKRPKLQFTKASHEHNAGGASMVLMVPFEDGTQLPLKVLRPLHPKECLWIAYRPAYIASFVSYLREAGFDSSLAVHRKTAPTGIWKRETGKFVVPYTKADNSSGYRTFKTEQEASDFVNHGAGATPESLVDNFLASYAPEAAEDPHSSAPSTS